MMNKNKHKIAFSFFFFIIVVTDEHVINLTDGYILCLGQYPHDEGEAGQHHAAVEVEGSVQAEAGLEQREQLERDHDQEAAEGAGHALQHGRGQQQLRRTLISPCRRLAAPAGRAPRTAAAAEAAARGWRRTRGRRRRPGRARRGWSGRGRCARPPGGHPAAGGWRTRRG